MSRAHSFKVNDSLFLVCQEIGQQKTEAKPVETPTHHVFVIDCSWSMSYDLPKIREQIKKRTPKILKEKDTFSLVWFSGRGEYGVLLEGEPVATLADLKEVNAAIDRWLKPVGLTGFKEPLEAVPTLVAKLQKKAPGNVVALTFMTDGCDNQWPRADVIKAVEKVAGSVASATVVEYGYYADRPFLTKMAENFGGSLIFAEDFDRYVPAFEAVLSRKAAGGKRVEVTIPGDPIGGFAYAMVDGDLVTYGIEGGKTAVPENLQQVYYLSPSAVGRVDGSFDLSKGQTHPALDAGYAAIALYANRMKPEVVYPLLKAVGDVRFIEIFSSCFGKQRYSEFVDIAKTAAFGKGRYEKGYDPNRVPREDAFTVLDVLRVLSEDDGNRILMESKDFKYSRIGRGRVDASENLTADELAEMSAISAEIAATKDVKRIKELNAKIAEITAKKGTALKFAANAAPDGYPVSSLTFNEDRPNVSVLVRKEGTIDLSEHIPVELKGKAPEKIDTFIWRNYAIIKDGLVNVDILPVRVTKATHDTFVKELPKEAIVADSDTGNGTHDMLVSLRVIPVINRKMVRATSAKSFFELQYALLRAQAAQKVYNSYAKELLPQKKSEGIAAKYSDEVAAWLKERGVTDGGFSPKGTVAEAKDFYMGKELKVSLKGFSKFPSLKELREAITKNKVNAPAQLMKPIYDEVESFFASPFYQKAGNQAGVLEAWLDGQAKAARTECRNLIYQIAQTTFCLVVGQTWFSEFSSLDENTMTIDVAGNKVECKAEMCEIEIKL